MAGALSVREDDTLISRLDVRLFKVESALALIGGFAVFGLMIMAVISVGGRNFLNSPLPGYVDWIEQAMPLIAFIGVSYCQRLGGHIRMDIFVALLTGRWLWLVEAIGTVLMLVLVLLLVWGSWAHFERSFDFAAPMWSRDSSLDIRLPLWPTKLLVPVSFAVLGLRLALQLIAFTQAFIRNDEYPVAVPLIEDAATIAAKEAETVSGLEEDETDIADRANGTAHREGDRG